MLAKEQGLVFQPTAPSGNQTMNSGRLASTNKLEPVEPFGAEDDEVDDQGNDQPQQRIQDRHGSKLKRSIGSH